MAAYGLNISTTPEKNQTPAITLDFDTATFNVSSGINEATGIRFGNRNNPFSGTLTFKGNTSFIVDAEGTSKGIDSANQNANIIFEEDADFDISGKNTAYGLNLFNTAGSVGVNDWAVTKSFVTFKGDLRISAQTENPDGANIAINNVGGTVILGMTEEGSAVNEKTVQITGDIISTGVSTCDGDACKKYERESGDTTIGLSGKDSFLDGKVTDEHMEQSDHRTELFIESDARWIAKGESTVGAVHADGGTIILSDAESTVALNNLDVTDDGINVQVNALSDKPRVTAMAKSGTGTVAVTGTPELTDSYSDVAKLVNDLTNAIVLNEEGTTKSLATEVSSPEGLVGGEVTAVLDENGKWTTTVKENMALNGYTSVVSLGAINWRHEMNDLTKRMGELRDSTGTIGAWARAYGSEQEYGKQNVTSKNTSIQVGSDYAVTDQWKVGAAFNYTDGSMSFDNGDGDSDAYAFGIYGTWLADNGLFVDLIGKYSRLSTEFTSGSLTGDYDNNGWSLSAEVGWQYKPVDFAFIEPQVELTYGRINGDSFRSPTGVNIEQDDFESLIGRVGVRTGLFFPEAKGSIYAKASIVHDFKGDMESYAYLDQPGTATQTMKDELGGTWYEYGIGANFSWSDNTYTYVDLQRTTAGNVNENWRWNIGIRHAF